MGERATAAKLAVLASALLVVGLLAPGVAAGGVLYDQTTGTPTGLVPSEFSIKTGSADCSAPAPTSQDCIAADDFVVPAPGWEVDGIDVQGQGGAGDLFSYGFLRDQGGLPAPGGGGGCGFHPTGSGTGDFSVTNKTGHGAVFPPGRHWLSFYACTTDATSAASWFWRTQSPQSGSEAAWWSSSCGMLMVWKYLSSCGQPGPDLRFRLSGQALNADFSFLKPTRKPNGGVTVVGKFPGLGEVSIAERGAKASGEARAAGRLKLKRTTYDITPRNVDSELTSGVAFQIKPTARVKRTLTSGRKVRTALAVTYSPGIEGQYLAPAKTQVLPLTLKRPKAKRGH